MSNTIKLKRGSGSDPGTSYLAVGEVSLRTDTAKLFTKNDAGNVAQIGASAFTSADQVIGLYDSSGNQRVVVSGTDVTIQGTSAAVSKLAFRDRTTAYFLKFKPVDTLAADVEFTFTTSETKCRELALIELLKARQQIALSCTVSLKQGLQIQCGDFVNVTLSRLGFTNKVFEVQEWAMNSSNTEGEPVLACTMVLREFDTTVYDNSVLSDIAASKEQATDPNANTNLSIATSVAAPTNLTLTQQSSPNTDAVEVVWEFDGVMSQFQIEYKLSSAGGYTEQVVPGFNRRFTIRGLTTGQTYNFRIKSISSAGSSSSFATANITL